MQIRYQVLVGVLMCQVVGSGVLAAPPRRVAKDYGIPQVQLINEHMQQGWTDYGLKPSDEATDGEWCRRLFLDVLGRIPTVDELRRFDASRDSNKRRALVDRLLRDEQYLEELARNWTTIWTNVLIGRSWRHGAKQPDESRRDAEVLA